ncbi:MAG: GNAT family N-acetyltransferase [Anaerolineaceae bacterium]|nr:GNAT family N-acetyltransferase [Anaerolineaceae bacterium]
MMNDVVIRRATLEDAEILATLNRDVQQIHADAYPNFFKQPTNFADIAADFKNRVLTDVDGFVLIIEADGQAAGYIYAKVVSRPENAYVYAQKYMLVDNISISPQYQNKGYGKMLMQAVWDTAVTRGIHRILLDTYEFNSNAQQFYAKMGFERMKIQMALDFNPI